MQAPWNDSVRNALPRAHYLREAATHLGSRQPLGGAPEELCSGLRPRPLGTAGRQESPAQSRDAARYTQGVVNPLLGHCLEGFLAAGLWFRRLSPAPSFPGRTLPIYFFIKPNDVIMGIPFLPRYPPMQRLLLHSQQGK